LDWLIPGLLRDKCIALVKGLPKAQRRNFVPVPDFVDRAIARMSFGEGNLLDALVKELKGLTGARIDVEDFARDQLDDFYQFNIQVTDNNGKTIEQGRQLETLREKLRGRVQKALAKAQDDNKDRDDITQWDFGKLERKLTVAKAGVKVTAYPALVDQKEATGLRLYDTPEEAQAEGERGLARLVLLALPGAVKQARKDLFKGNQTKLAIAAVSPRDELIDDLLLTAARQVFKLQSWPTDHAEFERRVEAHRSEFLAHVVTLAEFVEGVIAEYAKLRALLRKTNSLALVFVVGDIKEQWAQLLSPGFLWRTPATWLQQFPRYLSASFKRLEQVQGKVQRDTLSTKLVNGYLEPTLTKLNAQRGRLWESEAALVEFRYMIEEWRIQLFAQPMKTVVPVSEKRIKQLWNELGS